MSSADPERTAAWQVLVETLLAAVAGAVLLALLGRTLLYSVLVSLALAVGYGVARYVSR